MYRLEMSRIMERQYNKALVRNCTKHPSIVVLQSTLSAGRAASRPAVRSMLRLAPFHWMLDCLAAERLRSAERHVRRIPEGRILPNALAELAGRPSRNHVCLLSDTACNAKDALRGRATHIADCRRSSIHSHQEILQQSFSITTRYQSSRDTRMSNQRGEQCAIQIPRRALQSTYSSTSNAA